MKAGSRTLVKSPPELWEQVDNPDRMQGWMSALLGRAAEIEVTHSVPEELLAWQEAGAERPARIALTMERKGWGTHLEIEAEGAATKLEGWTEAVLEELAASEKRPFDGIV